MSHSLIVPSRLAGGTILPSRPKTTPVTPSPWPFSRAFSSPDLTFHSLPVLSSPSVASSFPSGLNARECISPIDLTDPLRLAFTKRVFASHILIVCSVDFASGEKGVPPLEEELRDANSFPSG